jgi:hypothetical protein
VNLQALNSPLLPSHFDPLLRCKDVEEQPVLVTGAYLEVEVMAKVGR